MMHGYNLQLVPMQALEEVFHLQSEVLDEVGQEPLVLPPVKDQLPSQSSIDVLVPLLPDSW